MGDDASGLRLRVLGTVGATRGRTEVDLGGRDERAILAVLVMARGELVTVEHLVGCLWRSGAPSDPAGELDSAVRRLRGRLGPDGGPRRRPEVVVNAGPSYALRVGPDAVDAWHFERAVQAAADLPPADAVRLLEEALRHWRGPAYAGFADQPWAEAEVTHLARLRAVAHERLLAGRLDLGAAAPVIPELEALVAQDPQREERWRLLVRALRRADRHPDAVAALHQARESLGVTPDPDLRLPGRGPRSPARGVPRPAAASRASASTTAPPVTTATSQRSPAAPAPSGAPGTPALPGPDAARAQPAGRADLVDRDREIAGLVRAVDDVLAGAAGVVLIEGPAGIGKTRLLTEAVRTARRAGVLTLSARGSELERSFGFGAVRQLFEPCVLDPARQDALLDGPAVGARAVFDQVGDDEPTDRGFAVLHGLYRLVVTLTSDGPLVLAVDDVQWCDSGSLRFLAYLLRRLPGAPVLVVMTLRTGEQHADDRLLSELALDPSTTVLRPRPLSPQAVEVLVRERLGAAAEAFVGACHHATSGNPLLLRQLLRALEAEGVRPDVSASDTVQAVGSHAVSSLVMARLRRMPADVTAVARAVAVLGRGARLPTVAALVGLPEERTAAALDALGRSEVLKDEQALAFVHPLVRDAVYDDVPASERALHHERAAHVLQAHGAEPETVAAHLVLAPERASPVTVAVLRSAARTAAARGASDSAVVLLRRALREPVTGPERVEVLLELGLAETMVDGPAAVGHLTDAYSELTNPRQRAAIAMVIAQTHVFASEPGTAAAFARAAATDLPPELDDARQGLLALERFTGYMDGLPAASYRSGPEPHVAGEGVGARMLAATLAFDLLVAGEERARAVDLAAFALDGDHLLAADHGLLWVAAADVLLLADADVGDFWLRAGRHARATGSLLAALSVNLWRGYAEWRRGHLDDALQSVSDAAEQQRLWGTSPLIWSYVAAFTAGIHLDRGDVAAARSVLDAAATLPEVGEGSRLLREVAVRALLEEGRPADALRVLESTIDPLGLANPVWGSWWSLKARALAALDRLDEAVAVAEEEVSLLRRWGAPSALGPALRLLGELLGSRGAGPLREAVQVLEPTHAVLELARAQLALGRSVGVADDEAVALLRKATDTARACGAHGVLRDATAQLAVRRHRSGAVPQHAGAVTPPGRPRQDPIGAGPDVADVARLDPAPAHELAEARAEFTQKETDVLVLVAAGWTDARIARRLGISQATVRQRLNTARERVGAVNRTHLVARWTSLHP